MEKEKWIDAILENASHVHKAQPDASLFSRLESRIAQTELPARTLWLVAASVAALIALNVAIVKNRENTAANSKTNPFAMLQQSNQLYQ